MIPKRFLPFKAIFILSFWGLVVIGYTQTDDTAFTKPQETISNLFPNSKISWSKELEGEMVNFRATSAALAIMIGNGDKRKIKFVNFKDSIEWSIDCDKSSCRQYELVGGDEPKLLLRGFEHGMSKTKLIDAQREEVFSLISKSWLSPSSSGKYYYASGAMESYKQPEVYDSTGRLMWKREEYTGGEWFAKSLSDSELIYEDRTGLYLLDAFSGKEIWKISKNQYAEIVPGSIHFSPASNGEFFVLFNGRGLVSLNREGEILWRKKASYSIFYIDISHDGRFVSIYSRDSFESKENRLALADNLDQGGIIWSAVKTERYEGSSNVGGLEISGDIVRLVPGIVDYRIQTGITPDMQTFCFQIDPENGKLLDEYINDGVRETFRTDSGRIHYLLIDKGEKKEIFRIEESATK